MSLGFELALAAVVVALIAVPHLLKLDRVSPVAAGGVWLSALGLRALMFSALAIFVFAYLPRTELFHVVKNFCLHSVVPVLTTHLGLSGHLLADTAIVLPALVIAGSVAWLGAALARSGISLALHLRRASVARGPLDSVVTDEPDFVVAATVVGPAKVIVSKAALEAMDEQELTASLTHEIGHIRRRHRPLIIVASILSALGRPLPGTRAAKEGFLLSLERDADEYAVNRTRNPLALASAICKAMSAPRTSPAMAALGGSRAKKIDVRIEPLMRGGLTRAGRAKERTVKGLAVAMVVLSAMLWASLPAWALAPPPHTDSSPQVEHCDD